MQVMTKKKSQVLFEEAQKVLVGGVNSPVRSFKGVDTEPIIMKFGEKQYLFDQDHNSYIDFCLSWGALILGHAHRNIVLGAKKTIEKGTSFGTTTYEEIEIAKHIVQCVPSIDLIRFVNSGTEATMSAIRLARGFTKRDLIIKFDGCYHGHVDDLLAIAGSGVANLSGSSSKGIPQKHIENTISLRYNDINLLEETIEKHKDAIAVVIIEPVAGNMGVIPSTNEFLHCLRELTNKYGIVLIFDEVMTGFRTQSGCVQSDYGIIPDLTCLGKIIGGGFPIGAYGGRKEIMEYLAPLGDVYQAGTFSGNPVVMKAGLATLRLLNTDFYQLLNDKCAEFSKDLNDSFQENDLDVHLSAYKSMMSIRFRREPVMNYDDAAAAAGGEQYARLFQHLLAEGIYLPPADLESFFVSGMHRKRDLDQLSSLLKSFFK